MEHKTDVEDHDTWLTQDILTKAVDHDLDYQPSNRWQKDHSYLGINLRERVDHSTLTAHAAEQPTPSRPQTKTTKR